MAKKKNKACDIALGTKLVYTRKEPIPVAGKAVATGRGSRVKIERSDSLFNGLGGRVVLVKRKDEAKQYFVDMSGINCGPGKFMTSGSLSFGRSGVPLVESGDLLSTCDVEFVNKAYGRVEMVARTAWSLAPAQKQEASSIFDDIEAYVRGHCGPTFVTENAAAYYRRRFASG